MVTTILETKLQTYEPINKLEILPPVPPPKKKKKLSGLLLFLLGIRAGVGLRLPSGAHLGGRDL